MTTRVGPVLVAHPSPDLYGSDRQLLETVAALVAAGRPVLVVLPDDGPLARLLEARGARVVVEPFPVLRKAALSPRGILALGAGSVGALRRLSALVRRVGPAVVYVNTLTIPVWLVAARACGRPVLCHVHEAEEDLPLPVRLALTGPLSLTHAVVANSEASARFVTGTLRHLRGRTTVIHNGIPDPGPPAPVPPRRAGDPIAVAVVGRLSPRKGLRHALEGIALLRASGTDVTLDVCGSVFGGYEWFERELLERASRPDLAGAVRLLGYTDPVRPVLERSHVVLVPSFSESFGNAAVEAMLAARPVVASDVRGLREILSGAPRTGLLVEPGSAAALAAAIGALERDPEAAARMGSAARAEAVDRFSTGDYARRINDVVARLARPGRAAHRR